MNSLLSKVERVVVEDMDADAIIVERHDQATLILRPGQTFQSAVRSVAKLDRRANEDDIRQLVRVHMPAAFNMDELAALPPVEPVGGYEPFALPPVPRMVYVILALILLLMVAGFVALHDAAREDYHQWLNSSVSMEKPQPEFRLGLTHG